MGDDGLQLGTDWTPTVLRLSPPFYSILFAAVMSLLQAARAGRRQALAGLAKPLVSRVGAVAHWEPRAAAHALPDHPHCLQVSGSRGFAAQVRQGGRGGATSAAGAKATHTACWALPPAVLQQR